MKLMFPTLDLQNAFWEFNPAIPDRHANALEFLDNTLKPYLRSRLRSVDRQRSQPGGTHHSWRIGFWDSACRCDVPGDFHLLGAPREMRRISASVRTAAGRWLKTQQRRKPRQRREARANRK